jgi:phage repressor protein C with HTH and peptisase S24 domain
MLGKRIESIRKQFGLSQSKFGKIFKVSQNSVSAWEKGRSEPEADDLVKLAELGHVTLDWLLTGKESTFSPPVTKVSEFASNASPAQGNWYPVVARVAAGMHLVAELDAIESIFIPYQKQNGNFAVVVEGDSMDGGPAPIAAGDYVLIDTSQTPLPGDIVVILADGRQMVKQLGPITSDRVELRSFNKEYSPIYVTQDSIEIMYRVVYHQPRGRKL